MERAGVRVCNCSLPYEQCCGAPRREWVVLSDSSPSPFLPTVKPSRSVLVDRIEELERRVSELEDAL